MQLYLPCAPLTLLVNFPRIVECSSNCFVVKFKRLFYKLLSVGGIKGGETLSKLSFISRLRYHELVIRPHQCPTRYRCTRRIYGHDVGPVKTEASHEEEEKKTAHLNTPLVTSSRKLWHI